MNKILILTRDRAPKVRLPTYFLVYPSFNRLMNHVRSLSHLLVFLLFVIAVRDIFYFKKRKASVGFPNKRMTQQNEHNFQNWKCSLVITFIFTEYKGFHSKLQCLLTPTDTSHVQLIPFGNTTRSPAAISTDSFAPLGVTFTSPSNRQHVSLAS